MNKCFPPPPSCHWKKSTSLTNILYTNPGCFHIRHHIVGSRECIHHFTGHIPNIKISDKCDINLFDLWNQVTVKRFCEWDSRECLHHFTNLQACFQHQNHEQVWCWILCNLFYLWSTHIPHIISELPPNYLWNKYLVIAQGIYNFSCGSQQYF